MLGDDVAEESNSRRSEHALLGVEPESRLAEAFEDLTQMLEVRGHVRTEDHNVVEVGVGEAESDVSQSSHVGSSRQRP